MLARILQFLFITLASTALGQASRRPEHVAYYVTVFAHENGIRTPESSHTYAVFLKVSVRRSGAIDLPIAILETRSLNWISPQAYKTGKVCALFDEYRQPCEPEPGVNRAVTEALSLAARFGLRATKWGPYEIRRDLYERAAEQADRLEHGVYGRQILYKAVDTGYREAPIPVALDCIHAISDIDHDHGYLKTGVHYGNEASALVVRHLERWLVRGRTVQHAIWRAYWQQAWSRRPPALHLSEGGYSR